MVCGKCIFAWSSIRDNYSPTPSIMDPYQPYKYFCDFCPPVCSDGDLRLVDSERNGEGQVEICFNNTYGSICADFWDEVDARVVCGQLGFMRNGQASFRLIC